VKVGTVGREYLSGSRVVKDTAAELQRVRESPGADGATRNSEGVGVSLTLAERGSPSMRAQHAPFPLRARFPGSPFVEDGTRLE